MVEFTEKQIVAQSRLELPPEFLFPLENCWKFLLFPLETHLPVETFPFESLQWKYFEFIYLYCRYLYCRYLYCRYLQIFKFFLAKYRNIFPPEIRQKFSVLNMLKGECEDFIWGYGQNSQHYPLSGVSISFSSVDPLFSNR